MTNEIQKKTYKFLFVGWESLSGDLAWQIQKEGHEVKIFIKAETDAYEGILEKVPDWKNFTDWADVIIFDDVGFGPQADALRKAGKFVVGGSTYTDKLEEDREFGQSEMKRLGLLTLPHWDFDNYDEALKFILENPGRYVYKPSGFVASEYKGLLFIAKEEDGKDLYEILDHNKKMLEKKLKQFQLQKYASGVEICASAFFNGLDFIYPITIGFEHKRLFPGELGPLTGEMGTSMFWTAPNNFFKSTLEKMKEDLVKSSYAGFIDINCIANARGIYPLEFTCRFGYPYISIQMEGIVSPLGEFLYAIASRQPYELKVKKGFQIGVVCATPPWPFKDKSQADIYHDLSILFKKPNLDGVHLGDVKLIDGDWRIAEYAGYDLVITGSGTSMEEARKQAYSRIDNIMLQNMFYRTDIGATWGEDSDKLQTWGYLY
ncbi:MAG: phosphoribosylamine--glycine ligase [bacterium]|nr:phosphoribosylamine--glycine ligase [bacterium]